MDDNTFNSITSPLFTVILKKNNRGEVYIERFEAYKLFYKLPIKEQRKVLESTIEQIEGKSPSWIQEQDYIKGIFN